MMDDILACIIPMRYSFPNIICHGCVNGSVPVPLLIAHTPPTTYKYRLHQLSHTFDYSV